MATWPVGGGKLGRITVALLIGVWLLVGGYSVGWAGVLGKVLASPLYVALDPAPGLPVRVRTTLALSNPNPEAAHVELVFFGPDEELLVATSRNLSPFETALIELAGFGGPGVGPFVVFSSGPPLAGVVLYCVTDPSGAVSGTAADPLQALASTHLVVPLWRTTPDGNPATILDPGFETFVVFWNPNPVSVFVEAHFFLSDETSLGNRGFLLSPFDWAIFTLDEGFGVPLATGVVSAGNIDIRAAKPIQGLVVTRTPEGDLYAYSPLLGPFGGGDAPVLLETFLDLLTILTTP